MADKHIYPGEETMSNANRNAQLILSLIAILISPLFGQDFATGSNSTYQAKGWQEE